MGIVSWAFARVSPGLLADDRQDVAFTSDQVVGAVFCVLRTGVLRVDDGLTGLHGQRDKLALICRATGSGSYYLALFRAVDPTETENIKTIKKELKRG